MKRFRETYFPRETADRLGRVYYFDNLKFVLIVLVIIGHFLNPIDNYPSDASWLYKGIYMFIYTFHMPAFVFVSGIFAKSAVDSSGRVRIDKVLFFLICYGFMTLAIFLINHYMRGYDNTYKFFVTTTPAWFLIAIAIWYASVPLLRGRRLKPLLIASVIVGVAAGFDASIGSFLSLSRVLVLYPFFILGYFLDPGKIMDYLAKTGTVRVRVICICALAGFLAFCLVFSSWYYSNMVLTVTPRFPYDLESEIWFVYPLKRIIWYALAAATGLCVLFVVPVRRTAYTSAGRKTIQIFIWHPLIIRVLLAFGFGYGVVFNNENPFIAVLPILMAVGLAFLLALKPFGVPFDALKGRLSSKLKI